MKKNIVIYGINGFIGKHLKKKLKNFKIYDFEKIQNKNFIHPFFFIHLAQKTRSKKNILEPNIQSLIQGLEYCKNKNCTFIYFSSLDANKKNSKDNYLFSKYLSEEICKIYKKIFKINILILKITNVYGPQQKKKFIIPKIISQLKLSKIKLMNLDTKRDFIHIDDIISLIKKISVFKKKKITFNIGTGKSTSIRSLIEIIENITKKKFYVENKNIYNANELKISKANLGMTKKILKWKHTISIELGLKKILNK